MNGREDLPRQRNGPECEAKKSGNPNTRSLEDHRPRLLHIGPVPKPPSLMPRILLDRRRYSLALTLSHAHPRRRRRRDSRRRRPHLPMRASGRSPRSSQLVSSEHHARPALAARGLLPDHVGERLHPAVLGLGAVGVEVDRLAVGEPHPEALFHEHVALLFFGEGGLAARAGFAGDFFLHQGGLVVDELAGFGEVDGGAGLACRFVVGGELGAFEFEEAAAPVLGGL